MYWAFGLILLNGLFYVYYYISIKNNERLASYESGSNGFNQAIFFINNHHLSTSVIKGERSRYNWRKKQVQLIPDIYENNSLSSVIVASHECSHALQHQRMTILSVLRIIFLFARNVGTIVFIVAIIFKWFLLAKLAVLLIFLYYVFCLFHEMEANQFALKFVSQLNMYKPEEISIMKKVLFNYMSSYLVNTLSMMTLVFFVCFIVL
jgi:uncharacterized protein